MAEGVGHTAKDYTLVIRDKNLLPGACGPGWRKHCRILFEEVGIRLRQKDSKAKILGHTPPGRCRRSRRSKAWSGTASPSWNILPSAIRSIAGAAGRGGAGGGAQHLGGNEFRVRHSAQRHANGPAVRLPRRRSAPALEVDIKRIVAILNDTRARFGKGGFFLFGSFTCADAMYAPLARRFRTYARLDERHHCRSRNGESEVRPS
jgi:glutathione S-transferase